MSTKKLYRKLLIDIRKKDFKKGDIVAFTLKYSPLSDITYGVLVRRIKIGEPVKVKIYSGRGREDDTVMGNGEKIISVRLSTLKHATKQEKIEFTMLRLTGKGSTTKKKENADLKEYLKYNIIK